MIETKDCENLMQVFSALSEFYARDSKGRVVVVKVNNRFEVSLYEG